MNITSATSTLHALPCLLALQLSLGLIAGSPFHERTLSGHLALQLIAVARKPERPLGRMRIRFSANLLAPAAELNGGPPLPFSRASVQHYCWLHPISPLYPAQSTMQQQP